MNVLTFNDSGSFQFNHTVLIGVDGSPTVDGNAQCVDHTAKQFIPYRNGSDGFGPLDLVTFLNAGVVAEQRDTHIAFFKVQRHTDQAGLGELNELTRHDAGKTVGTGNAVPHTENRANLVGFRAGAEGIELLPENGGHFIWLDVDGHKRFPRVKR